jgi:hypothetical protein
MIIILKNQFTLGCTYRAIRRNALEKIIDEFENSKTGEIKISQDSGLFAIFMTLLGIEKNWNIKDTSRKKIKGN